MQRLFSMFPAGMPGAALLLLRLCVAGMLWPQGCLLEGVLSPFVCAWLLGSLALVLCVGALTPICAPIALIAQAVAIVHSGAPSTTEALIHGGVTAALAFLGPGAYSIDARLFGRRIIVPDSDTEP